MADFENEVQQCWEQWPANAAATFDALQPNHLQSIFTTPLLISMHANAQENSLPIDILPRSMRHDAPDFSFNAIEPPPTDLPVVHAPFIEIDTQEAHASSWRRIAPKSTEKLVAASLGLRAPREVPVTRQSQISGVNRLRKRGLKKRSDRSRRNQDVSKPKRGRPSKRGETCIRCKLQREGCNGGTPCDRCKTLSPYALICVPADFAGKRLLRRGLYEARFQNLFQHCRWVPLEENAMPIYVELNNGFPFTLRLQAQQFLPLDEEPVRYCLFKGLASWEEPHRPPSSPYGLVPNSLSDTAIDEYLDKILPYLVERVVPKPARSETPSVFHRILLAALHHVSRSKDTDENYELPGWPLVQMAFRVWIIQGIFFDLQNQIGEGADRIGVVPLQVPGYFNNMRCPPRLLNFQLEAAFEKRLDTLEIELLRSLQNAIHEPTRGQWLSVFFATFLFLVSLEKDSWNLESWHVELRRVGGSKWPLGSSGPGPEVHGDQNQTLASMLGTVFQVRCQGSAPLKLDWNRAAVKKLVDNDELKVNFLKSLGDWVREQENRAILEAKKKAVFDRNDKNSLELKFASKLLLD